jgi:hypothetical protein
MERFEITITLTSDEDSAQKIAAEFDLRLWEITEDNDWVIEDIACQESA